MDTKQIGSFSHIESIQAFQLHVNMLIKDTRISRSQKCKILVSYSISGTIKSVPKSRKSGQIRVIRKYIYLRTRTL